MYFILVSGHDGQASGGRARDAAGKNHQKAFILTRNDTGMVGNLVKAYCVKCKKSIEMKDAKKVKLKNGKPATKGVCPKCGTKVFRIGE